MTNTPMTQYTSELFLELWEKSRDDVEGCNAGCTTQEHYFGYLVWQASQAQQAQVIAELREQIQRLGEMANICTYSELSEVCSYCNCKRKVKGK